MRPSTNIGITKTAPGLVRVALRGVIAPLVVDQLRVQLDELVRNGVGMVTGIVVNLSAVTECDCRLLPVLHAAQRQMFEAHGWLVVRGVDPQLLSGFAAVGLSDALAVYRASLALAEPGWPKEPGWTGTPRHFGDSEHRLLAFGVELATYSATAVGAVTGRLTDWCAQILGVRSAVILTNVHRTGGGAAVVSASDESARLAAVACLGSLEGPVVECLQRGEPVSAPDLAQSAEQWPRYVAEVLRHDVRAVRAVPLRIPQATGRDRSTTVGALVLLSRAAGPMAPTDLEVTVSITNLVGVALGRNPVIAGGARTGGTGPSFALGAGEARIEIERAAGVLAETEQLSLPEAHSRLADLTP
jgi:anti-anti-sigma regulatory factor